jgi:Cu(I)/Ag(I) efflux system periplasmic protein CusF
MKTLVYAVLAGSLIALPALADDKHHQDKKTVAASTQTAAALSDGEIRKVDKDAKKLTIRHGPLANLDMPAMTMVFQVQDAAMLDQVKPGDKVKFEAQKIGGGYTVTRIESAP